MIYVHPNDVFDFSEHNCYAASSLNTYQSMQPRNIILICLDTVRKDYFNKYATNLQKLSDQSYHQCRAASIWSAPSHASMFTGKLPHQHGVHAGNPYFTDINTDEIFLNNLDEYKKICVSSNPYAHSAFDFDKFFDHFVEVSYSNFYNEGLDPISFSNQHDGSGFSLYFDFISKSLKEENPIKSIANGFLSKLSDKGPFPRLHDYGASAIIHETTNILDNSSEPYFVFINFMDAHTPLQHFFGLDKSIHSVDSDWICNEDNYNPWEVVENKDKYQDYLKNRRGLYAALIDYLDKKVSTFISNILGRSDNTTIILTSDHGENLGYSEDKHLVMHKSSLTESVLHVPLEVINPPKKLDNENGNFSSHLKLGDLITSISENKSTDISCEHPAAEVIGLNQMSPADNIDELEYWDRMIRCVYDNDEKIVWDSLGQTARYEINHDNPGWQKQIETDIPVPHWVHEYFETEIDEYKDSINSRWSTEDIDEETMSRLEELGYL